MDQKWTSAGQLSNDATTHSAALRRCTQMWINSGKKCLEMEEFSKEMTLTLQIDWDQIEIRGLAWPFLQMDLPSALSRNVKVLVISHLCWTRKLVVPVSTHKKKWSMTKSNNWWTDSWSKFATVWSAAMSRCPLDVLNPSHEMTSFRQTNLTGAGRRPNWMAISNNYLLGKPLNCYG
jgi:hypothetical protein